MSGFIAAVRRQCEACGLPVSRDACSAEGSDVLEICTFGHVGDGNMHLNILARILEKGRIGSHKKLLDNIVFSEVSQRRGSISAEHGIGQDKVEALFDQELRRGRVAVRSAAELALMRSLKQALDPKGIMNPGKVFPKLS